VVQFSTVHRKQFIEDLQIAVNTFRLVRLNRLDPLPIRFNADSSAKRISTLTAALIIAELCSYAADPFVCPFVRSLHYRRGVLCVVWPGCRRCARAPSCGTVLRSDASR
jgi:hypothetical protein